ALAMADILTGDSGARIARTPAAAVASPSATTDARSTALASADARSAQLASADARSAASRDARSAAPAAAHPAGEHAVPPDAVILSRSEVDLALGDFAKLTGAVRGSFSASGVIVDAVSDGTIFQRAGLRAGDVITTVDGARLRTLDDA